MTETTDFLVVSPRLTDKSTLVLSFSDKTMLQLVDVARENLKLGKIIAVPTDTVYGVAALAQHTSAVKEIYRIKEREASKPLSICVGEVADIHKWAFCDLPTNLLEDLLPGPVTLVFKRKPALNPELNPDCDSIGIRMIGYPFMSLLSTKCDEPIVLTSANLSGHTSCLQIQEFNSLWSQLSLVINGGPLQDLERLGSTVVDLSVAGKYSVIRDGCALAATSKKLEKYGLVNSCHSDSASLNLKVRQLRNQRTTSQRSNPRQLFKCYQCYICPFFSHSEEDFLSHLHGERHKTQTEGEKVVCYSGDCMFMSSRLEKLLDHLIRHKFHFREAGSPACLLGLRPRQYLTTKSLY